MNHHGNVAWYWYLLLALPFLLYGAVGVILAFNVNPKVSIFGYILIADLPLYFYALGYLPNTFGYLDATLRRIFNYLGLTLCLGLVFLFYFGPGGYQSFLAYEAEEGVKNFFILYARPNGALWGSLLSLIISGYNPMEQKYEPLFTPWKIGNVEIKNRIVMTSMGGTSIFGWMEPNHFDKEAANFLLERAKNNVGLILPGIAPIRNPMFGEWLYQQQAHVQAAEGLHGRIP
jgi:hypothetical protein